MKANEQTLQQVERALKKVAGKFPPAEEASVMTDIHLRVTQETGELVAFDDDDNEINRCIVEQWIDNKEDTFFDDVAKTLRSVINKHKQEFEQMSILRPYSFVLENDDRENIAELYVFDDDIVILDEELMKGLDKDLDDFLTKLLEE
jgi:hypothetical protein